MLLLALLSFAADAQGVQTMGDASCAQVLQLLSEHVPEHATGQLEVTACARLQGFRTKLVVRGTDDPVATVVGPDGERIRQVVESLDGETIDILPFDEDPAKAACHAIAPTAVKRIYMDTPAKAMDLVVADDDVHTAAGPQGKQLLLAANLTGWTLNLYSWSSDERLRRISVWELAQIPDIDDARSLTLVKNGFASAGDLATAEPLELAMTLEIGPDEAQILQQAAAATTTPWPPTELPALTPADEETLLDGLTATTGLNHEQAGLLTDLLYLRSPADLADHPTGLLAAILDLDEAQVAAVIAPR